jgi:2-polyprenyl-6-methoxyphenol hydroxylase-like FAD-dependent oxidoreductase
MGGTGERFDVVVVGARCAGSPLATLLAQRGLRVCLLDKAAFPSDTPSTHMLQPSGVKLLEPLGVRASVEAAAARITRGRAAFDDIRFDLEDVVDLFGAPGVNLRRVTLDAILLEAAARAGVDVRTQTPVTGLVRDGERVVGVETRGQTLRAPLVVGADGARSTVARLVGAREYGRTRGERAFLWGYFEGVDADPERMWIGRVGDHGYLASFTDDGLFMAGAAPPLAQWAQLRGDRGAAHLALLRGWPELADYVAGARRVGPLQAMAHWHGFFRASAGPGWALVGDAGHFKDPTPGQGISDALRQTAKLAPAIERALSGDEDALRTWWRWRDADAWPMYWFARDMGAEEPIPPLVHELQRRMAAEPALAHGLLRVLNHDVAPEAVFTPRVVLGTAVRALRAGPVSPRALLADLGRQGRLQMRRAVAARRLSPA